MLEFYERRRIRRFVYSPLMVGLLLLPLYFLAHATWNAYAKERMASENREKIARELEAVKQREAYLEKELARLTSERGVERELRQKFDVGREGEEIIVLVGESEGTPPPATSTPATHESMVSRVLRIFPF